jgi:hypothetical protein
VAVQTVLDVVNSACYELNQTAPSTLFGNSDPNARQWLELLYSLGRSIRNRYDYPSLKRKYRFSTVVGQKLYPMPGDYWRLLLDTQWDETNDWALFGPEDDGGIAGRDLGIVPYGTQYSYRIAGAIEQEVNEPSFGNNMGYFEISPTATDVRELYIEYVTANWFMPIQWAASTGYSIGDLVSANGAIYKATSTGASNTTRPSGESTTVGETGVSFQLYRDHLNKITADTDYPIIDPEVLIQGLKARWLRAKGLDYAQEANEFEIALVNSISRFDGVKSINGDGPEWYEFPYLSEGYVSTGW